MIFDTTSAEEKIGYFFKDKMLLRRCFTHSSYKQENKTAKDNEVLEFLGDSIIEFVISEYLCKKNPDSEGQLTEERKSYVAKEPLTKAVFSMGIENYMLVGNGVKKTVKDSDKLYSDLFEAITAGIYLDGGMASAKKFITDKLIKVVGEKKEKKTFSEKKSKSISLIGKDAKTAFQEYVQQKKLGKITYKDVKKEGPDHAPTFTVSLLLDGKVLSTKKGTSKKSAELLCAEEGLNKIIKQAAKNSGETKKINKTSKKVGKR